MTNQGLLSLGEMILNQQTEITLPDSQILKNICKIYALATRMDLTVELLRQDWTLSWTTLFTRIITCQTLPFKPQKWAYTCLNRLMGLYGFARRRDKKYTTFSKFLVTSLAPSILECYLREIQNQMNGRQVLERIKQLQLVFLEFCCRSKPLFKLLNPHLEILFLKVVVPELVFKKDDEELWEDQELYVQRKNDPPVEQFRSAESAAQDLLEAFVRLR
jgi:importin-7